jgi:hypothetical protein
MATIRDFGATLGSASEIRLSSVVAQGYGGVGIAPQLDSPRIDPETIRKATELVQAQRSAFERVSAYRIATEEACRSLYIEVEYVKQAALLGLGAQSGAEIKLPELAFPQMLRQAAQAMDAAQIRCLGTTQAFGAAKYLPPQVTPFGAAKITASIAPLIRARAAWEQEVAKCDALRRQAERSMQALRWERELTELTRAQKLFAERTRHELLLFRREVLRLPHAVRTFAWHLPFLAYESLHELRRYLSEVLRWFEWNLTASIFKKLRILLRAPIAITREIGSAIVLRSIASHSPPVWDLLLDREHGRRAPPAARESFGFQLNPARAIGVCAD